MFGGGQELRANSRSNKKDAISNIEDDGVVVAICGGFGSYYVNASKRN